MAFEKICVHILRFVYEKDVQYVSKVRKGEGMEVDRESLEKHAAQESTIYREMMKYYSLAKIKSSLFWLNQLGFFNISYPSGFLSKQWFYRLSQKGVLVAEMGEFSKEEKICFYQAEDPYQVFVAHQFNAHDQNYVNFLSAEVLSPNFRMVDGKVEGLDDFRSEIMGKIRRSRFFVCFVTGRSGLVHGGSVSSVWMYQETGAAVALGKKPLLLVEEGVHKDYIGELQSVYEYVEFNEANYQEKLLRVRSKLMADLKNAHIPDPVPKD